MTCPWFGPVWHDRTVFPSTSPETAADSGGAPDDDLDEIEITPVRPALSAAIAAFAGLVGIGLIFGAQSSSPGARVPFALVLAGVQVLYVLAWLMATRPPQPYLVGGICLVAAVWSDLQAVRSAQPGLGTLALVAITGVAAAVLGQAVRAADRRRISESLLATLLLVVGVVAIA